ncbi:MAG: adenine phosphoribosyltransferase [Defluviitaleaceae bacterium]|nr:adenine phosphoribosyltransferase [Defluviitaleaceae bacterium]
MDKLELKNMVRNIPDFPTPGVMFRDITTVLKDPKGLVLAVDAIAESLQGIDFDLVLGPESRGFIFGVPLAYKLQKGFVPARKVGKLPAETAKKSYALEYGTAEIEIHRDAISANSKVVIVDDLLATGGTAKAVADLVTELGAKVVAMSFLIELEQLKGRKTLADYENVKSVLVY